jgi:dTDP-4-amino-4,6-dideoxygalactose transaminase
VAKTALIQRELKREKLVAQYAKKLAELKAIANDPKKSDEEHAAARVAMQKIPRNANPTRQRNRCEMTGLRAEPSASSAWLAPRSVSSPSPATSRASPRPAGKPGEERHI